MPSFRLGAAHRVELRASVLSPDGASANHDFVRIFMEHSTYAKISRGRLVDRCGERRLTHGG